MRTAINRFAKKIHAGLRLKKPTSFKGDQTRMTAEAQYNGPYLLAGGLSVEETGGR